MPVTTPSHPPRSGELPPRELQPWLLEETLLEEALIEEARARARRRRQRYGAFAVLVAAVGAGAALFVRQGGHGIATSSSSEVPVSQSVGGAPSALIAFSSWDFSQQDPILGGGARSAMFTMWPDGTHRRQLVGLTDGAWPTISPDGREIAVQFGGATRGARIDVMNIDGSGSRLLVRDAESPTWSPDGRWIAYSRTTQIKGPLTSSGIWMIASRGGTPRQLTSEGWFPAWSPDGTAIAYACGAATRNGSSLCAIRPDGRNRRLLARRGGLRPVWSPDSTKIAFQRFTNRAGFSGRIMIINADGSRPTTLPTPIHYRNEDCIPAWSPDGKQIAFTPEFMMGDGIYLANSDGTGTATKLNGTHSDDGCGISWQPTPTTDH